MQSSFRVSIRNYTIRIWTIPNLCLYLHRLIDYTKTCYLVARPKTSTFEQPFSARQHHRLRHTAWALGTQKHAEISY